MLTVETICKVRLSLARGESMRQVAKKYRMSRNTVKKVSTSEATAFKYAKRKPRYPMLGAYIERLEAIAKVESELPFRRRRTGKQIFEMLQREGYGGATTLSAGISRPFE